MKNFKIFKKLIVAFLSISLITGIVGGMGIKSLLDMKAANDKLYNTQTGPLAVVSDINLNLERLDGQARDYILYYDKSDELSKVDELTKNYQALFQEACAKYEPTIASKESKALFTEAKTTYEQKLVPLLESIAKSAKSGDAGQALRKFEEYKNINEQVTENFQKCMENRINDAKKNNEANARLADVMIFMLLAVLAIGLVVSVIWGIRLARSLSKPLGDLAAAAEKIADGHLDVDIPYESRDEIGAVSKSLLKAADHLKTYIHDISNHLDLMAQGDMTSDITQEYIGDFIPIKNAMLKISNDLNETLTAISTSSDQVKSGAEQVSDGAQELAQGATEQASSVEELAASTNEVSGKVAQNSENVRLVTNNVQDTVAQVQRGNEQMQNMLASMQDISIASSEIGKIIKVIDDIAFQTNILALNAAVEAARAGAAGKGFAVVADEVRNLASKSADAAKQTTSLIEGSIQSVQKGSEIANLTAKGLQEIADKVEDVGRTILEIDTASSEQAAAIQQISQGVDLMSSIVQTNSATAEESAAASEELSAQADLLRKLVGKFQLKGSGNTYTPDVPENTEDCEETPAAAPEENSGFYGQKY